MLEFYEFNTLNVCVVLISTFIIFYICNNYFAKSGDKEKPKEMNIQYLILSVIFAIIVSLIVSYIISGQEENLLVDGYWENTN